MNLHQLSKTLRDKERLRPYRGICDGCGKRKTLGWWTKCPSCRGETNTKHR